MPAPKGNNNAGKGKDWQTALEYAINNYSNGQIARGQALRAIGEKVVQMALEGDMECIKEIGNRLDGKPTEHKVIDKTVAYSFGGLSEASGILHKFAGKGQADDSQGAVSH